METRNLPPKEANVQSRSVAVMSREEYRKQQVLHAVTLKNIRVSEELFEDYGLKHSFE